MSIPIGAGAVVSNPTDIVKFSNALFNGKLLNKESLEKMITVRDGYGYGLFTTQFNDLKDLDIQEALMIFFTFCILQRRKCKLCTGFQCIRWIWK